MIRPEGQWTTQPIFEKTFPPEVLSGRHCQHASHEVNVLNDSMYIYIYFGKADTLEDLEAAMEPTTRSLELSCNKAELTCTGWN